MSEVSFKQDKIKVIGSYDTVVVGGGTAGSSCGISSAKYGNKTLIVEKSISLGGATVNGLVMPVMETFIPHGENFNEIESKMIEKGITTRDGIMNYVHSNEETKGETLEDIYLSYNGEILYDAPLVGVIKNNKIITHIVVTTVEGLIAIEGKQFVDATGDAILSRMAGVETTCGDDNGNNQMTSFRFEMGGINVEEYRNYCLSLNDEFSPLKTGYFFESAMVKGKGFKLEPIFMEGVKKGLLKEEDLIYYQCFSIPNKPGCMTFNCPHINFLKKNASAIDRSLAVTEGRRKIRRLVNFLREMMPGFENSYLLKEASALGVRESYRIVGKYVLNEDDYLNRRKFEDGIAKGDWYIDVHSASEGLVHMEPYKHGEYYEIPYRCLINNEIKNMLTIGRCISTTFLVQASTRIQSTVIEMSESAGKICALANKENTELANYKVRDFI